MDHNEQLNNHDDKLVDLERRIIRLEETVGVPIEKQPEAPAASEAPVSESADSRASTTL